MSLLGKHRQRVVARMGMALHLRAGRMSYGILLPMQLGSSFLLLPRLRTVRGSFLGDLVSKVSFPHEVATTDAGMERPASDLGHTVHALFFQPGPIQPGWVTGVLHGDEDVGACGWGGRG